MPGFSTTKKPVTNWTSVTHIAALQCVEHGLITLDEPVSSYLPELLDLKVLSKNTEPNSSTTPFLLEPVTNSITLRHLLSHSSGLDHESNDLVKEWRISTKQTPKENYHPTIHSSKSEIDYDTPLLYEPGKGWIYGVSLEWTSLLLSRLTGKSLPEYIEESIFKPLGMTSSAYLPQDSPDLCKRMLAMVMRREGNELIPVNYPLKELIVSLPDLAALLTDLIAPTSKLLKQEFVDLLFTPQFAPGSAAFSYIRKDTENYAAPAGVPSSMTFAPVNHSLAALVIEEKLELSGLPAGTVTWNGMPNFIWAMNREKGLVTIFATQLLPVDDEKTVDLAMEFFRGAWAKFG